MSKSLETNQTIKSFSKTRENIEEQIKNLEQRLDNLEEWENIQFECQDIIKSIVFSIHDATIKDSLFSKVFSIMGDLLMKRGDLYSSDISSSLENYNEAAIHYDYAMKASARTEGRSFVDGNYAYYDKTYYYEKLYNINSKILGLIGSTNVNDSYGEEKHEISELESKSSYETFIKNLSYQNELETLRTNTKERLTIIQDSSQTTVMSDDYINKGKEIFDNVAKWMKGYFVDLVTDSTKVIGEPPCKYSIMGLGSLALRQMTPYSDIEFAIITENNDYKNPSNDEIVRNYFKHLSHYLNFKVICLGETIIKTSTYDVNLGDITNRAINFDLGGKTSLGRPDKDYDLIATVDEMISYMDGSHNQRLKDEGKESRIDDKLDRVLQTSCYIYGDEGLLLDYQNRVNSFLTDSSKDEDGLKNGLKNCESRAIKLLSGDDGKEGIIEEFGFNAKDKEGQIFDVKLQIYRIPDRLIYNLSVLYLPEMIEGNVDSNNINSINIINYMDGLSAIEAMNSLCAKGIITEEGAHNLKAIITYANILRFRTYDFYHHQKESIDIKPFEDNRTSDNFRLNRDEITEEGGVFKFYYSAIALTDVLKSLVDKAKTIETHEDLANLKRELKDNNINFDDDSLGNKGAVCIRLMMYKEALGYYKNLLELQNNESGNQKEKALTLNTLGHIYNALGNDPYQSLEYYKQSLEITLKTYGNDPLNVATSYNNLGSLHQALGNHIEARKCYNQSFDILSNIYGKHHRYVATSYNNLGLLHQALGNHEEALEHFEQSLKIWLKTYGNEHPYVATSYNNYGLLHKKLGNHTKALEFYEQSLEIALKLFGREHPNVATSYNNLGTLHQELCNNTKALEYFEQSIEIWRKAYGNEHPDLASSYCNFGTLHQNLSNHREALKYHEKSLEIRLKLFVESHPDVATSYNNLGGLHQDLGNHKEALESYEKSLKIRLKTYGKDHTDVATSYNNLGSVYKDLVDHEIALKYFNQSLEILLKTYGNDNLYVAGSYNNLIILSYDITEKAKTNLTNHDLSKLKESSKDLIKSYELFSNFSKPLPDGIIEVMGEIKNKFYKQGDTLDRIAKRANSSENKAAKILEAFQMFNEAAKISKVIDHPTDNLLQGIESKSIESANKLLDILNRNELTIDQKVEYCSSLYKGAIESKLNIPELDDYIQSHSKDAIRFYKSKEYAKAQTCYEADIALQKAIYGEDASQTFQSIKLAKLFYDRLSDMDKNSDFGLKWQNTIEFNRLTRPIANFQSIPTKSDDIGVVRVISYNITAEFFDNKDTTNDGRHKWQMRSLYVKKILTDIDADVICLQELSTHQALEINDYLSSRYNGLFLSQTPSEIDPAGSIVLNDEIKDWSGLNCGTPLVATFVRKSYHISNDGMNSGRFWLKEEPDVVPINDDRGVTDKGFGNMNTYRAVLWSKVIETQSNKHFFVFNSHYPLSGDNLTRLRCAEVEVSKIKEITNEDLWVSVGDKNLIDKDESIKNDIYNVLTSIGSDSRDHVYGRHYGHSGTWLGFSYDKETRDVSTKSDGDVLDLIVSNAESLLSFFHPVGIVDGEIKALEYYNDSGVIREMNESRYFASDHCLIGADLELL